MSSKRGEFLPRPMCGNKPEWQHSAISKRFYLRCSQCRLGYDPQDYEGDLGTTEVCWNTRVPNTSDKAAIRELVFCLQQICNFVHSVPRDSHEAGTFYQARLAIAQEIAEALIAKHRED